MAATSGWGTQPSACPFEPLWPPGPPFQPSVVRTPAEVERRDLEGGDAAGGEEELAGELGLAGEIRPVPYGEERLREAAKHGFERAIVPEANKPRRAIDGLQVIGVERLADALRSAF